MPSTPSDAESGPGRNASRIGENGPNLGRLPVIVRLRRLITSFRSVERSIGEALHLHPTDASAMEIITREREVTPSRLAQLLRITSPAATFVIDRLVDAGHVERVPNPADRRSTLIRRIPASPADIAGMMLPIGKAIDDYYGALDDAQKKTVDEFLDAVGDIFERSPEGES